jgi:hypothetical protein
LFLYFRPLEPAPSIYWKETKAGSGLINLSEPTFALRLLHGGWSSLSVPVSISHEEVRGETILALFEKFMNEELGLSCLFLKNIKCVEIHEIAPTGTSRLLAKMTISCSDVD